MGAKGYRPGRHATRTGRAGRRLWAVSFAIAVAAAGGAWAGPAVVRHDLSVTLEPGRHALAAKDAMTVRADGAGRLSFSLSGNARVTAVTSGGIPVSFSFESGTLA